MNEAEIKSKLDQLSDFQAHRDLLETDKRALLETVQVPEEVQAIVSAGMKKISEVETSYQPAADVYQKEIQTELDAIVIPEEIKAQLADIDKKRAEIRAKQTTHNGIILDRIFKEKTAIQAEVEAATKDVYAALAKRKAEIEAEFSGKAEAVDENIRKLTEEIKADVKTLGTTVKADHFQAVYVKGRVTWDTSKMDGYAVGHPEVLFMRKEGEPSVTLRRI